MPNDYAPQVRMEKTFLEILDSINSIGGSLQSSKTDDNLVDAVEYMSASVERIANAIVPSSASPGHDEVGGTVASLTEAVMGITAGLCRVADAIGDLAAAVRERE